MALYHSTFDSLPAQLVFERDTIFSLTSVIDWNVIHAREKKQVDQDNIQENNKIIFYYYAVGDQVFVKIKGIIKIWILPKEDLTQSETCLLTSPSE